MTRTLQCLETHASGSTAKTYLIAKMADGAAQAASSSFHGLIVTKSRRANYIMENKR